MDAIGQKNTESLQEMLENLPLLEQMNQENAEKEIVIPKIAIKEYTQEQICEFTGVRPYLLRFWESEFDEIHPEIKEDGQKLYSEDDLITIQRVKVLLMEEKLTIERARHLLRKERLQVPIPEAQAMVIDIIESDPINHSVAPLETQMMEATINDSTEDGVSTTDDVSNEEQLPSAADLIFDDNMKVIAQDLEAEPKQEIDDVMCESNLIEVGPMTRDKSLIKTAFVTRFQKNEVGPGPAGVQLAQDLAIARAQSQILQQSMLQNSPQIDTLREKIDELSQIKNKLEGLILEIKLKRNIFTGNC